MGSAEAVNRLSRLATAVALAWALSPEEFGVIALALTTTEILQGFFVSGLGAKIIQAPRRDLEEVCNAAHVLNWAAYLIIFCAQFIAAVAIGKVYESAQVGQLIAALALPLLIYPISTVLVYRIQRAGRMRTTAKMLAARFAFENLATVLFVLAGLGIWAVVVPRLISAPVWVMVYSRLDAWRPSRMPDWDCLGQTASFGGAVLVGELVQALRLHADKFIIGHFLGLELLGVYYFAFNAGLGITTGLVTAFSTALLPHICQPNKGHELAATWRRAVLTIYTLAGPVVLAQIALAPIYVPLVFGAKWAHTVPLVMTLCACGLMLPLWRSTGQLLKAIGKPFAELSWIGLYAIVALISSLVCVSYGLQAIAVGLVVVTFTIVPLTAAWAYRLVSTTPEMAPETA
jgi:PST family polysaccharide transporter